MIIASYGSLARFRDVQRIVPLSKTCLMGSSGDISDFQNTVSMLRQYAIDEHCLDDGHAMTPRQWHTALNSLQYARRSKMDPLWNAHVIAGVQGNNEV